MPLFVAALIGGLIQACGSLVGRVLVSLGIGWVAYEGIDSVLSWLKSQIIASFSGLPADVITIVSITQCDTAINIVLSAILARLTIQGLTSGTMKRMVSK